MTDVLSGAFADAPVEAARGFRAALSTMARPGRIETVSGATAPAPCSTAAAVLLLTLCDPETPLYLAPGHDTGATREWIAFHIGAPLVTAKDARFALGTWDALKPLDAYPLGTPDYPDRSATLIVETETLEPQGHRLSGPGIETEARLTLPETAFFREDRRRFPLGLDLFLTCGDRLAAIPRTTHVEDA